MHLSTLYALSMIAHVYDVLYDKIVMLICVNPFVEKFLIASDVVSHFFHNLIGSVDLRTSHEQHTLRHSNVFGQRSSF